MKFALGIIILMIVTITIHGVYLYYYYASTPGFFSIDTFLVEFSMPAALFLGTVTGIISSIALENKDDMTTFFEKMNRRTVLTACVIAPVIIGGFYDKVAELHSFWVVFILAHQNGYFWENASARVRTK